MIEAQIGRRYAQAIYDLAKEDNLVHEVHENLNFLMETYLQNEECRNFLDHPLISAEEKKSFLGKVFGEFKELSLRISCYLVDKKRINEIRSIVAEYLKLYYEDNMIVEVLATFAQEPTKTQLESLTEKLKVRTGKEINLKVEVNPELIGGGVIKIGDEIMDGSVRKQLKDLAMLGKN